METVVSVSPLVDAILPILNAAVAAMITTAIPIILLWMKEKWKIDVEAKHRDAFQTAVLNGAGLLIKKYGAEARNLNFNAGDPNIKVAMDYVLQRVPDALDAFKVTPSDIATSISAAVGKALGGALETPKTDAKL